MTETSEIYTVVGVGSGRGVKETDSECMLAAAILAAITSDPAGAEVTEAGGGGGGAAPDI